MSYLTEKIGTVDVFLEYRFILVNVGDPAPTPADGYTVGKIGTMMGTDVYAEYQAYTGNEITPV